MKTNENKRKEIIGKLIEEGIVTITLNMDIDEDKLAERAAEIMEAYGDDKEGSFFWKDLTEGLIAEAEDCIFYAQGDATETAADVTYKVFGPSDDRLFGDEPLVMSEDGDWVRIVEL